MCDSDSHFHTHDDGILEKHNTVKDELLCHLPIAIFSVCLALIVLSLLTYSDKNALSFSSAHRLFHNFHFMHLLFAGTGTVLMFRRYSKNKILCFIVGLIVPAIFCTLSDAVLPYFGGRFLGVAMHFHWCFIKHISTVSTFLLIGILNGWVMSSHSVNRQLFYSQGFHFFHIFISSMASSLYLVSFGFTNWSQQMGSVFIFLIIAVLVPCTLSDIVIPVLFAKLKKFEKNKILDKKHQDFDSIIVAEKVLWNTKAKRSEDSGELK